MKTVMLIGAGVSRSAQSKLSTKEQPPLDADFFKIAKLVAPRLTKQVEDCLDDLVGEYSSTLKGSLETATTYLYIKAEDSSKGSTYHKGFLSLMNLISKVLAETTNKLKIGPSSHIYRFLLNEIKGTNKPEDLSIITFNYDLLLERVLEAISLNGRPGVFKYPGCYRLNDIDSINPVSTMPRFKSEHYGHDGVSVLKLHGSMSWHSTHKSESPAPSVLFKPGRKLHVMDSPLISDFLTWKRHQKSRRVYLKPIIVPPVSGKRGMMHQKIIPLWDLAGKALREADRVVIAGYSCPPLDLESRILLSENLRLNEKKRVYLVDPNPRVVSTFAEMVGVDHATSYFSMKAWIRDSLT